MTREELDKENGKLEGKLADLQSEYFELENLHNSIVNELKEQIDKMKCCENCKHFDFDEPKYCHKGVYNCAYVCDKWELGD